MNTSTMEIPYLKTRIENKIRHSYLEKYISNPVIDEEKLIILASIINNTNLSSLQKEKYIITTMLVQAALDTHEAVPATNDPDESKDFILTKQLNVLAGDYYSGLYYLLLSEIEDFELIHTLATAIKEINEFKMVLYYNEIDSLHEYIHTVKKIESLLILHVINHVKDTFMAELAEEWLIMNKLMQEKSQIIKNDSFFLAKWLNAHSSDTYLSILDTIDDVIKSSAIHVDQKLITLPVSQAAFREHANDKLRTFLYNNTSLAEEG